MLSFKSPLISFHCAKNERQDVKKETDQLLEIKFSKYASRRKSEASMVWHSKIQSSRQGIQEGRSTCFTFFTRSTNGTLKLHRHQATTQQQQRISTIILLQPSVQGQLKSRNTPQIGILFLNLGRCKFTAPCIFELQSPVLERVVLSPESTRLSNFISLQKM